MLQKQIETFIGKQYRKPLGIVGRIIGNRMAQKHEPENSWTVSLLSNRLMLSLKLALGQGRQ
ncbi:MAG: hypothetical protein NVSMB54_19790 [Ktedonobacteraceae bacterium]